GGSGRDGGRGRQVVKGPGCGATTRDAVKRREPQSPVASLDRRWMPPAVALGVQHAVRYSVRDRIDLRGLAVCKVIQLFFADSIDPLIAAHPEIGALVFENGEHSVAEHAFLCGV